MKSKEIRQAFIDYFKSQGHTPVPSSRTVPEDDPTLLFTNAGMNQFKAVFMGLEKRDYTRAVSAQKCVRAGGKHNDLENVGHTARHHTFFEMLGNFSFGDYFKKEAIHFAWEFITQKMQLPKDRLYVSVFETDDESADIWHRQEGVAKERIYRFGEKDNFWRMGDSGPCGPCSEIYYDLGPEVGGDPQQNVMGGDGDRFMEIWNLVFMQYFEDGKGGREKLPNPSVDTGLGLERLSTIMQGQTNNYHTDLFLNLIAAAEAVSGQHYVLNPSTLKERERALTEAKNVAFRVLADHARACSFLIADGVLPTNAGRGYVLRRIMRRAIRYGRQLSQDQALLAPVAQAVIEEMGDFYHELQTQRGLILSTIRDEEQRFLQTLDQGTHILQEELQRLKGRGATAVSGDTVFKLYDTYGFPVDLTQLMSKEQGFAIDQQGFEQHMQKAREQARATWKSKSISQDTQHTIKAAQAVRQKHGDTQFVGYETTRCEGTILLLTNGREECETLKENETGMAIFDQTVFYAESGGQVGDTGTIQTSHGQLEVVDCTKHDGIFFHHVRVVEGHVHVGEKAVLQVAESARRATASNHSATHLLHAALKQVLGPHVQQSGSLVDGGRLRFDFTHNQPVTPAQIEALENLVNGQIAQQVPVATTVMDTQKAIASGAVALFGEKYGDQVRVLTMGDFSTELCGGTHVPNTAMIRLFKIVSESGVSSGVRRIEAITGDRALQFLQRHTQENLKARELVGLTENWENYLNNHTGKDLPQWIEDTRSETKNLQRKLHSLTGQQIDVDKLVKESKTFSIDGKSAHLVLADVDIDDRKVLSELSDRLRDKVQSGIVVVVGRSESQDSLPIIVTVSKDLTGTFNAGRLLKDIAAEMDGRGGGRPDFAQGAGKDHRKVPQAFAKAEQLILK